MIVAVLLTLALACGPAASPAGAAPAETALATVSVPGGVAALAEAAGLDPSLPRARVPLAIVRALYEVPDGVDPVLDARRQAFRDYLQHLTPGEEPSPELVPLPLSAAAWDTIIGAGASGPLLSRLLGQRDAALVYYGLAAIDEPTGRWMMSQPNLLRAIGTERRPGVVAAFGRSLRIRDGQVVVPGGPEAEPLWQAVVGVRPDQAYQFVLRLLDADRGRLALFYDTIAHLDSGRQAFALGLQLRDPAERRDRFRRLYDESGRSLAGFDPTVRPFDRVTYDLAHTLLESPITPDGYLHTPESLELWRSALTRDGIPDDPRNELAGRNLTMTLDAAALMGLLSTADAAQRRDRAETWLFGQRVFGGVTETDYPDVLVALRGVGPYKMLLLTLERIGIRQPGLFARAVRRARRIGGIGDADRARAELAAFQGALSIIERARFSRVLSIATASELIGALCDLDAGGNGQIAGWVSRALLPVLDASVQVESGGRPDRPIEDLVLGAMSGLSRERPGRRPFNWEGLSYRIDPAAGEFRRVVAIRARQGGVSLDTVLALHRASASLVTATSPAALAAVRDELTVVASEFARVPPSPGAASSEADAPLAEVFREAQERLERFRSPSAAELARAALPVVRAADAQLAAVLLSLAYAPHLGYPDSPVLLGGDPSRHHDFGTDNPRPDVRERLPWQVGTEVRSRDTGWRVTGSALGLDMVLSALSLRRAMSETFPPPPAYRETERAAFAEAAVLTNPFDADDLACAQIVTAVQTGRERLARVGSDPVDLAKLAADAGLDEWRTNLVAWMAVHEPERVPELISLGELARLGGDAGGGSGPLVASGWSRRAELQGVALSCASWTTLAGRKATSLVPALVPDLALGIAEAFERLHVPCALLRGVLLMATQDLLDSLRTCYDDDWMTLIAEAQRTAAGLVEDYVAGQTIWGALIPDDGGVP